MATGQETIRGIFILLSPSLVFSNLGLTSIIVANLTMGHANFAPEVDTYAVSYNK